MEAELGAEVRDGCAVQAGVLLLEPAAPLGLGLQPRHDAVVALEVLGIRRARGQLRRVGAPQQLQRVVVGLVPEQLVDAAEQGARLAVPAPRQVHGDLCQPLDARGEVGHSAVRRHQCTSFLNLIRCGWSTEAPFRRW